MRLLVLSLLLPLARAVDLPTLVTCLQQAEAQSTIAVEWGAGNCNIEGGAALQGVVMDAVCAVTLHKQIAGTGEFQGCTLMATQAVCTDSSTKANLRCKWDADASSCKWNRDSKNNVCVRPPQGHADLPASVKNCAAIVSGQCPEPWEVPGGCCLEEHMKYVGILYSRPGFVCCNAPCTSLAAGHTNGTLVDLQGVVSNVTTYTGEVTSGMVCGEQMGSSLCAPGMRSYFSGGGMGMPGMGGLMDRQMQYSTMGLYAGQPMQGGRVTQAYGSQGDDRLMRAMMSGMGGGMGGLVDLDEDVMESGVDEISIDDFMDVLIDALNTDADVFESDRQITTDPWFGRQDIGLGPVGVKLDDPLDIFDDIYGNLNFGQNSKNLLTSPYMSRNDYTTSLYGTPQLAGQFPRTPFGAFGTGFNMSHNPLAPDDADDDSQQMGMMGMMNMMGMSPMGAQQMSYIQPMPMQQQNPWLAMAMQQQQAMQQQAMQQQTAWQQNLPGQAWQGMPMQQQVNQYPPGWAPPQQQQAAYPPGWVPPQQQPGQYPPGWAPPQQQQAAYPPGWVPPQQQPDQFPPGSGTAPPQQLPYPPGSGTAQAA